MKFSFYPKILNILIQIWPNIIVPVGNSRKKFKKLAQTFMFFKLRVLEGTVCGVINWLVIGMFY